MAGRARPAAVSGSLKGSDAKAQGNALGKRTAVGPAALKGRHEADARANCFALSGLAGDVVRSIPRALPWAVGCKPFGLGEDVRGVGCVSGRLAGPARPAAGS